MKKTYINPTMEVIKLGTQQMLAASNPNALFDLTSETTTMDSRSFYLFDE